MTGRFLGAEEALSDRLRQPHRARRRARRDHRGARATSCSPRRRSRSALAKRVIDAAAKPALEETLELEVDAQERLAASDDFAEGASAFMEKRAPELRRRGEDRGLARRRAASPEAVFAFLAKLENHWTAGRALGRAGRDRPRQRPRAHPRPARAAPHGDAPPSSTRTPSHVMHGTAELSGGTRRADRLGATRGRGRHRGAPVGRGRARDARRPRAARARRQRLDAPPLPRDPRAARRAVR